MGLLKRVYVAGTGRAMILPAQWLRYWKEVRNQEITQVEVEVNEELTVKPVFSEKGGKL